jgi:hypothetical protein
MDGFVRQMATVPVLVGTVLLALYVALTYWLFSHFGFADAAVGNWERAMVLYNSVTTLAFAAAGVVLGVQVQQKNVAAAKAETQELKTKVGVVAQQLAPPAATIGLESTQTVDASTAREASVRSQLELLAR